jgi:hypothetical protein
MQSGKIASTNVSCAAFAAPSSAPNASTKSGEPPGTASQSTLTSR